MRLINALVSMSMVLALGAASFSCRSTGSDATLSSSKQGAVDQAKLPQVQRFTIWLDVLDKDIEGFSPSESADKLLEGSARNGVFNLQGLARLYEDTDPQFEKARKRFKALEDGIGGFAKWDELLEKAEKKSSESDVIAKLRSKRTKARKDLEKLLVEEKFIRETKSEATYLKTFRAFLLNREWNSVEEDRKIMLGKLSGQLQTIKSSVYDFTKLEEGNGIHEFRRKIRWFSMEARALNGLLVLKPATVPCPIETYKDLPTSEWAKSKYGVLPPSASETAPVAVTACLYVKMARAIDDVGKIKDAVEEVDNNTSGEASDAASLEDQALVKAIYNEMIKSRVFDLLQAELSVGLN
jgi:hypothetical protein